MKAASTMFASLAAAIAMTASLSIAQAQPVSMAGAAPGSQNNSVASGLAKVLSEKGKMNIRVQSFGGEGVFMPLLNKGEVDVAPITSPQVIDALKGVGPFEGKAQKNLRAVGVVSPIRTGVFVRKDSPIKDIKDIKGKRIVYDLPAHPSLARVLDGVLANAGLTISDMKPVSAPNVVRGVDEFVSGNIDVGFFALTGGKLQEAAAAVGGVRFLSLIDTPEAVAAMKKVVPTAYLGKADPKMPGLIGVQEPINVMSYDYLVMVNASTPDDLVYKITKTLWENDKAVQEAAPATRDFSREAMFKKLDPIEYHPGALKFFKEAGAKMKE